MTGAPRLLTADLLYTGMGLPIQEGGVVVSGGTIAAAGKAAELRAAYPHAQELRAGHILAPPPVNAHTHLDMSLYDFHALPYFRWIPEVVIANRARRGGAGARLGLARLRASGAGGFGDIVWSEDVMAFLLSEAELPGTAYWEVLDPNPATADATFARTVARVQAWRKLERPGGVKLGLSPHATYTVSHRLFRLLADYARAEALPLQIHVAEHESEAELFSRGTGGLAETFAKYGYPFGLAEVFGRRPDPQLTPVQYLADLGVLDARPTLIHMVHVSGDDVRTVAQAGCPVVTCPRSNHNLSCGTFPWPMFAAAGVEVALGTDSVASGETLDIHDELAFARGLYPQLDERTLVRAAVKGGARVVGEKVPFLRRGEPWREAYVWPDRAVHGV